MSESIWPEFNPDDESYDHTIRLASIAEYGRTYSGSIPLTADEGIDLLIGMHLNLQNPPDINPRYRPAVTLLREIKLGYLHSLLVNMTAKDTSGRHQALRDLRLGVIAKVTSEIMHVKWGFERMGLAAPGFENIFSRTTSVRALYGEMALYSWAEKTNINKEQACELTAYLNNEDLFGKYYPGLSFGPSE